MYGQGYPGYLAGYPAYGPLQYYPPLAAAAAYYPAAAMQPPVRPPTLVMPVSVIVKFIFFCCDIYNEDINSLHSSKEWVRCY